MRSWTVTSLALTTACVFTVCFYFAFHSPARNFLLERSLQGLYNPQKVNSSFHYLVPATSSNSHLCRLLASAAATGFPPPVLLMWQQHEEADQYKTHVAKVDAILNHLDALPMEHDDDLVLIMDGFDVWHQLPPSILIQRYREAITAANSRLKTQLGRSRSSQENTILFGPDKICWPEDVRRAACWAVPESTLDRWAFGPDTDSGAWRNTNRPRWLNSGTILGPVKDVRRLVAAVRNLISTQRTVDSDQFYFATIWGRQEYARRISAGEVVEAETIESVPLDWAGHSAAQRVLREIPDGGEDFGITIDYSSALFQTVAYYADFLRWAPPSSIPRVLNNSRDLSTHSMPLSHLSPLAPKRKSMQPWTELPLGINTASDEAFAVIHFTPPKSLRDKWWSRMWFFPHLRDIIDFAFMPDATTALHVETSPNAHLTTGAIYPHLGISHSIKGPGVRALVDSGSTREWRDWSEICGEFEVGIVGA